jgi:hypothetical protein
MRIMLDSQFHRDRKELYLEFRMGQLLGSRLPQESAFATNLIVNFFDGGPRTSVEYRVGKRDPVKISGAWFARILSSRRSSRATRRPRNPG